MSNVQQLQKRLNYSFSDEKILTLALSHRSYGSNNNERLEFLGDSILGLTITDILYRDFPKAREGELSRMRSHIVTQIVSLLGPNSATKSKPAEAARCIGPLSPPI